MNSPRLLSKVSSKDFIKFLIPHLGCQVHLGSFSRGDTRREEKGRERGEKKSKRRKERRKDEWDNKLRCGGQKKGKWEANTRRFCVKDFEKIFKLGFGRLSRSMEQYPTLFPPQV